MRSFRLTALAFTALAFILAACDTGSGALPLPGVTITDVNSSTLAPSDEVTVTGSGFYQTSVTAPSQVEVCGVSVPATLVEPVTQRVVLPPGGTVTVQTGSTLAFTVPDDGFTGGEGQTLTVTRPDGSSATYAGITCVAPVDEPEPTPVTAALTASVTVGVAPATIGFSAVGSTGEGELGYSWDFGHNDATSSEAETAYEYPDAGNFTVTLTVTDATGATDSASQAITVHPPLQAVITASTPADPAPTSVQFDGTSSTGVQPITYAWDFGDGSTSTDAEPTHEYQNPGLYTVELVITDAANETSRVTTEVAIASVPVAAVITADPTVGTAPLTINFSGTDSTGHGALTYAWDFGDNTGTSTEEAPTYEFALGGTYNVALTVTDSMGVTATTTQSISVNTGPAGLEFQVEPAQLLDGNRTVHLSFTDGTGSNQSQFSDQGHQLQVTPGPVELEQTTITWEDTDFQSTWIAPPQTLTAVEGVDTPVDLNFTVQTGSITLDTDHLPAGATPTFDLALHADHNHNLTGSPADITDLGNLIPGVYTITPHPVEVDTGAWIEIYEPRETTYTANVSSQTNQPITIEYNLAPGTVNIGDTGLPAGLNPVLELQDAAGSVVAAPWDALTPGEYSAQYEPTTRTIQSGAPLLNNGGAVDAFETWHPARATDHIVIGSNESLYLPDNPHEPQLPTISIRVYDLEGGEIPAEVEITGPNGYSLIIDETSDETITLPVPFGEYFVSVRNIPNGVSHNQLNEGTGYFRLLRSNDHHAVSVSYVLRPVPAFTYEANGNTVTFNSSGSSGYGELEYTWDFGDNSGTSTDANPTHTYATSGTYTVSLTVTDSTGVGRDTTEAFTTYEPPVASLGYVGYTGYSPTVASFDASGSTGLYEPLTYHWDFGENEGTSTEIAPTYTYTTPGEFIVRLTVTDTKGSTATASGILTITAGPVSRTPDEVQFGGR